MTEDEIVELDYAFYGTLPDGWYLHPLTGQPIKAKPSMTAFKKSRTTPSQGQAEFAKRFNAHFETKVSDSDTNE
jgi:hypothetical protein